MLLRLPYISPRLGSSVIVSTSWIQCDPRDPWNRHMTPTVGDRILVGKSDSALH